jgi:hypothetical protein
VTLQDDTETPVPNGAHSDGAAATPAPATAEKKYWLDQPGNVRKIYLGLWVVCLLLAGTDLLYEKHPHFAIESVFGFYAFYGYISCVSLVLAAKLLRKIVMRPEDYYDR